MTVTGVVTWAVYRWMTRHPRTPQPRDVELQAQIAEPR
jgi:hypothetical protein